MIDSKTCKKCSRTFPATLEYFKREKNGLLGITARCKECFGSPFGIHARRNLVARVPGLKVCSACLQEKAPTEFNRHRATKDGLYTKCRSCKAAEDRSYQTANVDKVRARGKAWAARNADYVKADQRRRYLANKEERNAASRAYYRANREDQLKKTRENALKNPERTAAIKRRYVERNPEIRRASIKKHSDAFRATPQGKITTAMRASLARGVRSTRGRLRWVPYTIAQLMEHLGSQFAPGMTWDNYGRGGWHVGHRRPVSHFNFESPEDPEFAACWALTNLFPQWEKENIAAGNRKVFLESHRSPSPGEPSAPESVGRFLPETCS